MSERCEDHGWSIRGSQESQKKFAKKKDKRYTEKVLLFFIFYFMDIANPVAPSYTFFEKYFKVLPEGRIRRYQFFVRFLIPGIIFLICSIFLIPALLSL